MSLTPHPTSLALKIMDGWLGLPEKDYKAKVYMFAQRLTPEDVLDAVWIAQAKLPEGGIPGLKYFCGVCHNKIRERRIQLSWN